MASRPIVVDLFAGAGGLSLGFEQAGYDVLAAVELDPIHAATHEFNFPYGRTFCADARKMTGKDLRRESSIGDQEIDAVVGGAPCQGFSLIGKRALDDPRNGLIREFIRLVVELQPRHFVLENVAGLMVGKHRRLLQETIELAESAGYQVRRDYRALEAADYGVPQARRRLFLLGARAGEMLPTYPEPVTRPRSAKGEIHVLSTLPSCPSVWEAIGDLPEADEYPELLESDSALAKFGRPSAYAALLRGDVVDASDLSRRRPHDPDILTSSMRTVHTTLSISRFEATQPGEIEPVSRFLRLHPEGISNTLRAGTASDRGAFTSPRPIHPYTPRCITVREAARLHGYPDWFRFHETKWHGFRQIGNSVPPPLAKAVARQLFLALDRHQEQGTPVALGEPSLLRLTQAEGATRYGVDKHVIPPRRRSA